MKATPTFVVIRAHGPEWVNGRPMREQEGWDEHARFMDGLAAEGFALLGGPVGEGGEILLIVEAGSETEVRKRFEADPWSASGLLTVESVRTWTILLDSREVQGGHS